MPIFSADGRRRFGAITEMEARARNLEGAGTSLVYGDRGEVVVTHERAGVYWRERASLRASTQPLGWSGGRPPGGFSKDAA